MPRGLRELAAAMLGGTLFRSLCSLLAIEPVGLQPTFAFALRVDDSDERLIHEYDLTACDFAAAEPGRTAERYLAHMECWATDLLQVLDGELGPIARLFGRAHLHNALPGRFHCDPFAELYRMSHPLRRPDATLRVYQREWARHTGTTPRIRRR